MNGIDSSQMPADKIFSLMCHDMPCFPFIIDITPVIYDSAYAFFVLENDGMFLYELSCGNVVYYEHHY